MRGGPVAVHAAQDEWVWYLRVCVSVCEWVCASCVCTRVLVRACERVRARFWVRGYARTRVCACARVRACCVWEVCKRVEAATERTPARRQRGGHRQQQSEVRLCTCSLFAVGSDASRSRYLEATVFAKIIAVIMYQMRSGDDR